MIRTLLRRRGVPALSFPLHHAEQRAWQRIERALVDGLLNRANLQHATEDRVNLLRCEGESDSRHMTGFIVVASLPYTPTEEKITCPQVKD